jgi:hypothetical protein
MRSRRNVLRLNVLWGRPDLLLDLRVRIWRPLAGVPTGIDVEL